MFEITNSTGKINGFEFDFRGYKATLGANGEILEVIRLSDNVDVTEEMRRKYK